MRTKHILTALAIPALFAACVADDFNESIATGGESAQRALLSEDFQLNFGGVDTRFSAGDADDPLYFSYEVGDTIGGSIIDEYKPNDPSGNEFPVVPYVSTNHPFVLNSNGVWAINHTMVEGHYLFYFPYNENNHARTAAQYSIPVLQDLAGKDGKFDPKAAVEKYNMGVGVQFLEKTDLNASLQLVNIYGFAKIKVVIDNHYPGGYVDKIVLQADDDESFKLNGQISNQKVNTLFANLEDGRQNYEDALELLTKTEDFALENTSAGYYDDELNKTSQVMVAKAPEGTALVSDGQNNKTFETYMVVPAAAYTTNATLYIYTTDGNVYKSADNSVNLNVDRNKVRSLTVSVEAAEEIPYVVTSEKDWNQYVSLLGKGDKAKFIIAGSDFTVTNNTKYPTNDATITVTGDLTVSGNNVTMKNITATKVIVKEGAKLTTDGTLTVTGNIENHGTLVFAKKFDEADKDEVVDYRGVTKVSNQPNATMTVLEGAIATTNLNNIIDEKNAALPHGKVEVNGMLILTSGSSNNGDIIIATTGSLRGTFSNYKEKKYPATAGDDEIKNRYTPTITNNGEIFATDVMTNDGKVVNNANAEISCSNLDNAAEFNNAGLIELADKSNMMITDNANGEIKLSALDQTGWAVENANGTVSYETKAADNGKSYDFSKVGTQITKLYVTGDFGFTNYGKLNTVEVTKSATVSLPLSTVDDLANLTIKDGATVTAASKDAKVGTLIVEEDARLTINADNAMSTTEVKNYGRIYVGGTFKTEMSRDAAEKCGGEFRNTVGGDNGNIVFKNPNAEAQAAFDKSLQDLVKAYVTNSSAINATGGIDSWGEVTFEAIQKCGWTTPGWSKTAMDAVLAAYQTLKGSAYAGDFADLLAVEANKKVITDAITTEKETADAALKEAMAEILPTTWLGSDVYVKDETTKKITKYNDGKSELKAGWRTYINTTYAEELNVDDNKPLWLSAKSYVGDDADVPADSYINNYAAGEGDYEVMYILSKLPFEATDITGLPSELATLQNVKDAMEAIYRYSKGADSDAVVVKDIEKCGILNYYDAVRYEWQYDDDSIKALWKIMQEIFAL